MHDCQRFSSESTLHVLKMHLYYNAVDNLLLATISLLQTKNGLGMNDAAKKSILPKILISQ